MTTVTTDDQQVMLYCHAMHSGLRLQNHMARQMQTAVSSESPMRRNGRETKEMSKTLLLVQ